MLVLLEEAVGILLRLIGVAQAINFVVNLLQVPQSNVPPATSYGTLLARTQHIESQILSPLTGLAEISASLATVQTDVVNILSAIHGFGSGYVNLPPTAPTGYGGASTSDIADAVWNFPMPFGAGIAIDGLTDAHWLAHNLSSVSAALPSAVNPDWWVGGTWDRNCTPERPDTSLPTLDYSTILETDATTVAWLNRQYSAFGPFSFNGELAAVGDPFCSFFFFLPVTQPQFDAIKAARFPKSTVTAPVWPGASKVTLGGSVAIATGVTITTPMDGVIIDITSVPAGTSFFPFDTQNSWRFIGAVSFFDDSGEQEFPQGLGFQHAVYSPKEMVRAAGVRLRAKQGIAGTITPWTVT